MSDEKNSLNAPSARPADRRLRHGNWQILARRLVSEPGWVPPACMIAAAILVVAVSALAEVVIPGNWAKSLGPATFLTWLAVGLLATLRVAARAFHCLSRLGVLGLVRPRWWFEIGRLSVLCFLLSLLSMMALFLLWMKGAIARHDEFYAALGLGLK
jgi:hypothetical protein